MRKMPLVHHDGKEVNYQPISRVTSTSTVLPSSISACEGVVHVTLTTMDPSVYGDLNIPTLYGHSILGPPITTRDIWTFSCDL